MSSSPSFLARGARARSGAALLVLAAAACDTNTPPTLDPTTAASSFNGVGMILDLPTVSLALSTAGATLHAMRPGADRIDTVAAVWHSSDEHVVSVGTDGHLVPHTVGNTKVWARVGHDSVASAVTVSDGPSMQVNGAAVAVRPTVAMMAVGAPQQFNATVQAAAGVVAAAGTSTSVPAVTWTSSAPAVAAVSSNGTVVPIAPGIALITATALGVHATSTVMVTAPRANAAARIDVAVMRFDGGSGSVMVSNGIPFARGAVTEATLNQVHVFVNGTERPIFTRALGGRWPDGSLRAALIQFDYTIPNAQTIPGYISIGGARTLAAPAERAAVPTPIAAALPTSSAYLISTGVGGALYDPTATRAPTNMVAQYEGDYVRLEANDWGRCGAAWSCGRTAGYDRPYILYQQWVRTANPTYWQHASAIVANYIDLYLASSRGMPAPWWSNSEGVAAHYWATGDERTRGYVHSMAASQLYGARPGGGYGMGVTPTEPQMGDDRMRAKVLLAMIDARRIDAKPTPTGNPMGDDADFLTQYMASHPLENAINEVLSTQQPSGAFGGTQYKGGEKPFMVGILLTALIRYYDEISPDARIPIAVKRSIDYMMSNEWVASAQGFKYCSFPVDVNNGDQPEPSLNNLIAPAYAWYYNRSGDARYATMVDQMLTGAAAADRGWWDVSGKSFDQAFYHAFNTMRWRNR